MIERSEQKARELGQIEVASWCLQNLAEVDWLRGDGEQALMRAQRSLELAEQASSTIAETIARWQIGQAHVLRGEPEAARAVLEEALATCRDRRVARMYIALILAGLADAHLALGDAERARDTAQEGVSFAERAGSRSYEVVAELARLRALRAIDVAAHRAELASGLDRCEKRVGEIGAGALLPFVLEERARLAGALGDPDALRAGLEQARRAFAELEATGHAERLQREIEPSAR